MMKNNGVGKPMLFSMVGLAMLAIGLVLIKMRPEAQGILQTSPYILMGIGAGIFGGNLGTAIKNYLVGKDPKATKQMEIEQKDERNVALANKAKGKAYDMMLMVFGALLLAFSMMQVDLHLILTLVGFYLFVVFTFIYYLNKYHKEM